MTSEHRYELKFIVDAPIKERLLERAKPSLEHDPHGKGGYYRVSSQYFDSPDFKAYWEKLDGVGFRRKFRLRYYGDDPPEASAHFEIKHRWDQTVFKERVPLKPGALAELVSRSEAIHSLYDYVEPLNSAQQRTLESILAAAAKQNLSGTNIISYQRQAWVGKYDRQLRVTFDHLCRAFPPGDPMSPLESLGTPILEESKMVLEVKFNDRLPLWLRDCLSQEAVQPIRFSKYAEGMAARSDFDLRQGLARLRGASFPAEASHSS